MEMGGLAAHFISSGPRITDPDGIHDPPLIEGSDDRTAPLPGDFTEPDEGIRWGKYHSQLMPRVWNGMTKCVHRFVRSGYALPAQSAGNSIWIFTSVSRASTARSKAAML